MGNTTARGRFGWQGIEADVPTPWELSAYRGDRDSGYAALDDGVQVRFQVRWNRRGARRVHVGVMLDRYCRSLHKKTKGRAAFDRLDPGFLPARARKDREVEAFRWHAEVSVFGFAWTCHTCGRVGLAEVLFPVEEVDRPTAIRVLSSTEDHRSDGQCLWSVYDFAFLAPHTYNLQQPDFVPGRLCFRFRAPERARLTVGRWSMAAEWLKKRPLEDWSRDLVAQMQPAGRGKVEQCRVEVRGHEGWRFLIPAARRGLVRRAAVEGLVWHCTQSDKVYAVVAQGSEDGLPETVAATVQCV